MSRVLIGRIGRKHGLGGEFYLTSFVPLPSELPVVYLEENPDSPGEDSRELEISSLKQAAEKWLVVFNDEAESLTGKYISAEQWALEDGFYWREDLVGCEVEDCSGRKLGRLSEVIDDASQVWVKIEKESGEVVSVPFLARFVKKVDTAGKKIVAEFPESTMVVGE